MAEGQETEHQFRYRAFISYSHRDRRWGNWLHRALETYRVPRKVVKTAGRDGPVPARLYPIFRDREELPASADLSSPISAALEASATLVVICSPHGAQSRWVNEEILTFKRMRRADRIIALIVGGEPNASDKPGLDPAMECFPPALRFELGDDGELSTRRTEPIAGDARPQGDGRNNGKLKIIAGILGIGYDALKRREETRQARRRFIVTFISASLLGAALFYVWQRIDRGTLTAESFPVESTISVDQVELGAHIKGLSLRTGRHQLIASAPDHFEVRREIDVERGKIANVNFWLEDGVEGKFYRSPALQSGLVLVPAKNDTLLVTNELSQILFWSTASQQTVGLLPTPDGNRRSFGEIDLGGAVGKIIVSARDAAREGPDALIIPERDPQHTLSLRGTLTKFDETDSLSFIALSNDKGAADLALAGRDGQLYRYDAASGKLKGRIMLSDVPFRFPPMLAVWGKPPAEHLLVLAHPGDPNSPSEGPLPLEGRSLTLPNGETEWHENLGASWDGAITVSHRDGGAPDVVVWNAKSWAVFDGQTGARKGGGSLRGPLLNGPAPEIVEGALDLALEFTDPALSMQLVRASDGTVLWQGPDHLNTRHQPRGPAGSLLRAPGGAMLITRDAGLAALDPKNGHILWSVKGEPIGVLVGDWNGDGVDEILVTMNNVGLLCLDGRGKLLWTLRLQDSDVEPWGLVSDKSGGPVRDILIHKHASLFGLVHGPRRLWQTRAAAPLQARPVIAKGTDGKPLVIEVGNWGSDESIRAFGSDGGLRWAAKENIAPNRGAALSDLDGDGKSRLVAISLGGADQKNHLLAYDPADGALVCDVSLPLHSWLSCTPAVADFRGTGKSDVAFNTWDDKSIVMVDGRSGQLIWKQQTKAPNMGGVGIGDLDGDGLPDVVASSFDGHVYALRGKDGRLLWKAAIGMGGWATPVVAHLDGRKTSQVLVIDRSGRLYVLDGATGAQIWASAVQGGGKPAGAPLVVRRNGRTMILAPQGGAGIIAYDWESKKELWRSPAGLAVINSPVLADFGGKENSIVAATATGDVFVFRLANGAPLWHERVAGDAIEGDPAVGDLNGDGIADIVLGSHDFELCALNGAGTVGAPAPKR